MGKKFIYTIASIAVLVILATTFLVILPLLHPSTATASQYPFFKLVKVSNINYSGNDSVQVYFISWYGCPLGATDSWGLYIALSKYCILNVTPNYSDLDSVLISPNSTFIGKTPGLLFVSCESKSNVIFHFIYLLGRAYISNSTATLPNGTMIKYSGDSVSQITSFLVTFIYFRSMIWVSPRCGIISFNHTAWGSVEPNAMGLPFEVLLSTPPSTHCASS